MTRRVLLPLLLPLLACEIVPPVELDNPWDGRNAGLDADKDGFPNGGDACPTREPTVCDGAFSRCEPGRGACGCCNRCPADVDVPDGWSCIPATGPEGLSLGSPEDEPGRDDGRERQHVVHIGQPFLIRQTEVTQAEWTRYLGTAPAHFSSCGGGCPVERVSWYEALTFANRLSDADGLERCYDLEDCDGRAGEGLACAAATWVGTHACAGYRLPTEAEWEYAARAETSTSRWIDDSQGLDCDDPGLHRTAWIDCNSDGHPHPVATKEPNPWGLYDVYGNVFEWVWDALGDYEDPATDPTGPAGGAQRVLRGGSWANGGRAARSAHRSSGEPNAGVADLGFRLARSVVQR